MSSNPPITPGQHVLPPEPWYRSEVQVRAVIALAAQLISILFRAIGRYTDLQITDEQIDLIVADITQAVAIIFGIMAVLKRKDSPIQPLTLTAGSAAAKAAQMNPILPADPTKQKGFARALMLSVVMMFSVPVFVYLHGCGVVQTMQQVQELPYDQQQKLAVQSLSTVNRQVTAALDAHVISSEAAAVYRKQADGCRDLLRLADELRGTDLRSAMGQLQLANNILLQLQRHFEDKQS